MTIREPGYYWIKWSEHADADMTARRPGPLIGQWDGRVWWFACSEVYQFDCEVIVMSDALAPPQHDWSSALSVNLRVA